ncbi:MAG: glucose-6-phosphate isomerase [Planctomycetota bacterium]|nr:glucose-6-phosphate isomerase [Planctomycetota bacterium]
MRADVVEKLQAHYEKVADLHMRDLFEDDENRFAEFSCSLGDILLDYSKNRVTPETIALLLELAEESGVYEKRAEMFSGRRINSTEDRAVLHTALRNRSGLPVEVEGQAGDVMEGVDRVLAQMRMFCDAVHSGERRGYTDAEFTDIVSIGIGGSALGPLMVTEALKPYARAGLRIHFVSNVDATDIVETLKELDAESTLFVVVSKTFTTEETLANALSARAWFLERVGDVEAVEKHFVAVSVNEDAVTEFGIDAGNMFEFWDWVGGRYSIWGAVGLPIALYVGMDNFESLLAGAHDMDLHFQQAEPGENIPLLLGLLGVWYNNFFGMETHAVLPYDQYLRFLPDYLQQLDMESCGKSVTLAGEPVDGATGMIIWGGPGTDGQHAYFQLLHQGTRVVPADFIAAAESQNSLGEHHLKLLANFFAQTEALMLGKTREEAREERLVEVERGRVASEDVEDLVGHKEFPGNRPSNSIFVRRLDPRTLGALLAMYEHKVFVQGCIWGINPYDQWGVELGKSLASRVLEELRDESTVSSHDSSTNALVNHYKKLRREPDSDT